MNYRVCLALIFATASYLLLSRHKEYDKRLLGKAKLISKGNHSGNFKINNTQSEPKMNQFKDNFDAAGNLNLMSHIVAARFDLIALEKWKWETIILVNF